MDTISIPGYENIVKTQQEFYEKRIGTVYGVWKVIDITYDWENKKQLWTLKCTQCGTTKTVNHKNFLKTAMWCSCQRVKAVKEIKPKKIRNNDESYIGKIYGDDKIIGFKKNKGSYQWVCECQLCHETHLREPYQLKSGEAPKCKCKYSQYDDSYIGRKFGRLTIIGFGNEHRFVCQCECGTIKEITPKFVIDGSVVSCGCYSREISDNAITKSPLYHTWRGMLNRCFNKSSNAYKDYGARGITVCDKWKNDFHTFEEWCIQNGYRPNCGLSIDRINVNGNYEPDNCRFASVFVQNVNQRPRKSREGKYIINGISKTKREWCKEYNVWEATVSYRIKNMGMSFEDALTAEKIHEGNHHPKLLDIQKDRKQSLENLNKINSYIECNLYMAFCRITSEYQLIPQYKILNYRADFLVKGTNLVIECDGYDQHKTKEQISSDYKRQRDIENEGYSIIRFSGSEINKNVDLCVSEILKRLSKIDMINKPIAM